MSTKAKAASSETIETVIGASSDAMKQSMEKAMKGFDELASFNKSTVDAFVESANAASKGMEKLSAEMMAFQKQSIEDFMSATKAAMASRSVQEFMEINSDYAKSAFDSYVGKVSKFGDMATTTAKDAINPISNRFSALVEIVQNTRA